MTYKEIRIRTAENGYIVTVVGGTFKVFATSKVFTTFEEMISEIAFYFGYIGVGGKLEITKVKE